MQMKEFLQTYAEVVQTNHDLVGQVSIFIVKGNVNFKGVT